MKNLKIYGLLVLTWLCTGHANAQLTLSGPGSAYSGVVSGPYSVNIPSNETPFLMNWNITNGIKSSTPCNGHCIYVIWNNGATSGTIRFTSGSHGNSNTKTVSISPPPPPPSAPTTTDVSRCGPGPTTLTVSGGGSQVSGYRWYYNQSGGSPFHTGSTYNVPGLSQGETQTYWVSAYNGFGESGRSRIRAIINSVPTANAGNYGAVCSGVTVNLSGSPSGGAWSGTGVSGNTFSRTTPGNYTLTYSYTNGSGCSDSDQTTITVKGNSTPPNVTGGSRCGTGQVTLTASYSGTKFNVSYQWYQANGTPISGATSSTYSPSLSPGTHNYQVSMTHDGLCESTKKTVTATVYNNVDGGTLSRSSGSFCQGSNDRPTLTIAGGDTPSTVFWQMANQGANLNDNSSWTTITDGNPDGNDRTFAPSAVHLGQSRYFRRKIVGANCTQEGISNHVLITVNTPPVANAGNYTAVCQNESISLGGSPSGGTWSGTGVSGSTFSHTTAGNYTLTYSYTDSNGCSDSDQTTVTVKGKSNAPTVTGDSRCGTGPVTLTATFTGSEFNVSYQWYQSNGTPISGATSSTYSPSLSPGTHSYLVSMTHDGLCESTKKTVTATVYDNVDGGTLSRSSSSFCLGSNDFPTLTITGGDTPSTVYWQMADQGADLGNSSSWTTITDGNPDGDARTFAPSVLHLAQSRYFRRKIVGINCTQEGLSNHVLIIVNAPPVADAGAYEAVCQNESISLVGSPAGGTWSGTGVTGNTFSHATVGNYTLTYSYTDSNGCSDSDQTTVTVKGVSNTPSVTGDSRCGPGPVTLTATFTGSEFNVSYQWYENDGSAISGATSSTYSPSLSPGTHSYLVSMTHDGLCESTKKTVTATVYDNVDGGTLSRSSSSFCLGSNDFPTLTITGGDTPSTVYWQMADQGADLGNSSSWTTITDGNPDGDARTFAPSVLHLAQSRYFRRKIVGANCTQEGISNHVLITVNTPPVANAGNYTAVCQNESISLVGSPAGGTWSGTGVTGNTFSHATVGNYTLTYSYTDSNGCSDSDQTTVTVKGVSNTPSVTGDSRCGPGPVTLTATFTGSEFNVSYQWYEDDGSPISGATSGTYSPNLSPGTYTYRVSMTHNGLCESAKMPVYAVIHDYIQGGALSVSNNAYCLGSNEFPTLTVTGSDEPLGVFWQMAEKDADLNNEASWIGITDNDPDGNPETFVPTALHLIQSRYFRRKITSANCPQDSKTNAVLINVNNTVEAGTISFSGSQPICWNSAPDVIEETSTPLLGNKQYSFEWYYSTDNLVWSSTGITTRELNYTEIKETTYFQRKDMSCDFEDFTNVVEVITKPPIPTPQINGQSLSTCVGENKILQVSQATGTVAFEWKRNTVPLTNTESTINVSDPSLAHGLYTYSVIGINNVGCTSDVLDFDVVVHRYCDYWLNYIENISSLNEDMVDDYETVTPIDYAKQTTYFDGLGRAIQTVAMRNSPLGFDMVTPVTYDEFNRTPIAYLPYVADNGDGRYEFDAMTDEYTNSDQFHFYNNSDAIYNSQFPYAVKVFESAPSGRVDKQGSPGDIFQPDSKPVLFQYELNAATEVLKWNGDTWLDQSAQYYDPTELRKNITIDEDGNTMIEFQNKSDQVILKKSQIDENNWASTYYIYDFMDRLKIVLPPEASERLDMEFFAKTESERQSFLDAWAFQYKYDHRNRMIEKKVPGAEMVLMVYDRWDRLVLTQDGNQRANDQWLFTKYDQLNRPIITGLMQDMSSDEADIRQNVISSGVRFEYFDQMGPHKYSSETYPKDDSGLIVNYLTVTYYDHYDFLNGSALAGYDFEVPSEFENTDSYHLLPVLNPNVLGQVTGSKSLVLGTADFIESVTYYDEKYRVIQTVSQNHLGGVDIINSQYDFTGNARRVKTYHDDGANSAEILLEYELDHANRLTSTFHTINGENRVKLYTNEYNELGELVKKNLHGSEQNESFAQSVDYEYTIRGWLKSINKNGFEADGAPEPADFFSLELIYYTPIADLPNN